MHGELLAWSQELRSLPSRGISLPHWLPPPIPHGNASTKLQQGEKQSANNVKKVQESAVHTVWRWFNRHERRASVCSLV